MSDADTILLEREVGIARLVLNRRAQDIIVRNRRVRSAEAERIGLIAREVDDEELVAEGAAAGPEFKEGVSAFANRFKPDFVGNAQ